MKHLPTLGARQAFAAELALGVNLFPLCTKMRAASTTEHSHHGRYLNNDDKESPKKEKRLTVPDSREMGSNCSVPDGSFCAVRHQTSLQQPIPGYATAYARRSATLRDQPCTERSESSGY